MKTLAFALAAVSAAAMPTLSAAQETNPLSFNVSVTSDYRFRGISQSRFRPAVQGGVDYALPNGFYVGAWASTIRWIKDAGEINDINTRRSPVELDLYGGYKGQITSDFGYDVGVLQYLYPRNALTRIPNTYSPNTFELYGALSFGPATLKYSHALTRLFGTADSKHSGYLDLTANFDVGGGVTLTPHVGHQRVRNNSDFSYTDYSLTVAKEFYGFTFSLAAVGTDTKKIAGAHAYASPAGNDLGRFGAVVAVKKTF
ncbi:TorF family putative porin [Piscinibacter koreensis]|uniref:Uncharacterized protein n=1 Tax=Piscinibacter koreensis TaxID=2742824 RepID=A0A7Y6NJ81_9BURK|nr:TorF family putative porin [Schlegelella koreensis]NUZ04186.1 hypothetical protein [Schlegelella koreensis]